MFDKIKEFVSGNPLIAIGAGLVAMLLFFPRMFRAARRRKVRRAYRPAAPVRRRRRIKINFRPSIRRSSRRVNKAGKKPWQVKGSRAARLHMAKLRRMK